MKPSVQTIAVPELPKNAPLPPVPGQSPGTKPGVKSQTSLSWLNTGTGQAQGTPSIPQSGKALTGQ